MTFSNCKIARSSPKYSMFNPACIHCGARIIQCLGTLPIAASECSARRKAMLKVWTDWGHSEERIRALVKGEMAFGPVESTASAGPTPRKQRSAGVR